MNPINYIKSWFGTPSGGCASSTVVSIDPFTSNLIYNASYSQLATEGYIENVISHTCIKRIAEEVAHLPFEVFIGDDNIDEMSSPLAKSFKDLIKNPTVDYDWPSFITDSLLCYCFLVGNGFKPFPTHVIYSAQGNKT